MKAILFAVRLGVVIGCVLALSFGWLFQQSSKAASKDGKPVVFEVPQGATGRSIAEALAGQGLIHDALAFRILLTFKEKRDHATLQAGFFEVDPSHSLKNVLDGLLYDSPLTRKATIPEGFTLEQTAQSLEKQGVCSAQDVWAALKPGKLKLDWEFPSDLEGYLFPSTYEFAYKGTGEDAVRQMTKQFRSSIEPLWKKYQATAPLSFKETIILASLVEREAQVASERPLIAGVYVNRLRKGMKLQCDATVQYALGESKPVLLYSDLEIASPYNTYRYAGLPPGPICSPGEASIKAAMSPKKSDYLFYVRNDVKNDGSHVFARDEWGHQDNIAKFQR